MSQLCKQELNEKLQWTDAAKALQYHFVYDSMSATGLIVPLKLIYWF